MSAPNEPAPEDAWTAFGYERQAFVDAMSQDIKPGQVRDAGWALYTVKKYRGGGWWLIHTHGASGGGVHTSVDQALFRRSGRIRQDRVVIDADA